jgi:hypothetical protein
MIMKTSVFVILLAIAAVMTFCAACTGTESGGTVGTTTTTTMPTMTTEATTALPSDMIPGPTQQPESQYQVDVQVNKDEVFGTITAIFRGGFGQNYVDSIVVDVYYPDGSHESKDLGNAVGDQVQFPGNQKLQDRVKITVNYMGTIGNYVIYDSLVPPKLAIPNP